MTADNPLPGVPLVESPLFERLVLSLPPDIAAIARRLREDGFAIIDFPEDDFERLARDLIAQLESEYNWTEWREKKAKGDAGGMRIQDSRNALVRRIAANPRIVELLSLMYGRPAFPFQTLNFPVGTEQHFHTDAMHFSSIPERFMCGVWVALEDIGPDQGPLVYYPGSHKLPIYTNEHFGKKPEGVRDQRRYHEAWEQIVCGLGLERRTFCARRGQALVWAANLLHGGDAHANPEKTRWTQVTHYYFDDCVYLTPMHSDVFLGRVELRRVLDLRTDRPVEHRYLGETLPLRVQQFYEPAMTTQAGWNDQPPERLRPTSIPRDFDEETYLRLNPDVRAAGINAKYHYLMHGAVEGRPYRE